MLMVTVYEIFNSTLFLFCLNIGDSDTKNFLRFISSCLLLQAYIDKILGDCHANLESNFWRPCLPPPSGNIDKFLLCFFWVGVFFFLRCVSVLGYTVSDGKVIDELDRIQKETTMV
jgi:hypothetical protein